jgi:hypothetical protein
MTYNKDYFFSSKVLRFRNFGEKNLPESHELVLCVGVGGSERVVLRPHFPERVAHMLSVQRYDLRSVLSDIRLFC